MSKLAAVRRLVRFSGVYGILLDIGVPVFFGADIRQWYWVLDRRIGYALRRMPAHNSIYIFYDRYKNNSAWG